MSALDVNWLRPVSPGGQKPLQILVDWFALNGVVYHASSHQREVLVPLCRELNTLGVQCEVDQILDYVSYLQEVVHDAATLHHALPEDLIPYRERLQTLLFKDGHSEASSALPNQQKRPNTRLSWLEPSPYGGLSGMEVLVDWLKNNYSTYAHATRKGEKGRMLEDLVKQMRDAGIQDCAVNTVRAKIDVLHREVRGEKSRSAAWEQFGSVLEEIFTVGDAGHEREDAAENSDGQETGEPESHSFDGPAIQTHSFLDARTIGIDTSMAVKPPVKHTRNSPASRLSWMKQVLPGAPTAMELLVDWMKNNYAAYTQSKKKGEKGRMLIRLLHKIEEAGHRGCTIHAIRVKIDSLQRQAGGKARPSSAFDQYGASLKRVFAEKDNPDACERAVSPPSVPVDQDGEDSHISDDEAESDASSEEVADGGKSTDFQVDLAVTETPRQVGRRNTESRDEEDVRMLEVSITSPNRAVAGSDSETEDEQDKKTAKVNPIVPQVCLQTSLPTQSPSTSEIVRIATLLRERHDLLQRGVSQEQVDKFLPLPDV
ncbi:hypothetical protein GN244_ATG17532 [Phytophthora infestans]|uniref:Uncharacterized protein n=1 Tax=Phytophthora infestans TaxID=4787 RepID=A0A833SQY8_PHYIN|nr:hypothetical protein GN244_ATG17532 [Phytophthora infestans]KAF4148806.1 hypothetical protein GN958_ATG02004 [Phytophthora infestans]